MKNCQTALFVRPRSILFALCFLLGFQGWSQQDRFEQIAQRLKDLALQVPGLNQKTDLSISDGSIQEFLRALADVDDLNLNIDPSLNQKMTNTFSAEKASDILLFLARQYNLDINFIGTIINIGPYRDPMASLPPPPKMLKISYDTATRHITMDLRDDTLLNVIRRITQLTNENIIVKPELYNTRITQYIQDLPLRSALEQIAVTQGFRFTLTNDNVIELEALQPDEEIQTRQKEMPDANFTIRKVSKTPNGGSASSVNEEDGKKMVTLVAVNTPIRDVIKNIAGQAGINYFVYTDLSGTITADARDLDFDKALQLILQGTRYTYTVDRGVYMIGDKNYEGLREKKLIQLKYRSVDSLISVIPLELRDGVEIKEFKELNGMLLTGSGPQIREIESFVKQIDRVVPMITLDVIMLDINRTRTVSTGLTAGTSDSVQPGGTLIGAGGLNYTFGSADVNKFLNAIGLNNTFNLGHVTPNFYVTITALENNGNVTQRQTPKLSTLNGHTANLSIGNTEYYAISTQNVVGSLSPQTVVTQQFVPVEANLAIDITPFVSGDDDVTLTINVSISNFTSTTSTINQPPPTSTSKFRSIIRVKNDEMILLGGIERTVKNETVSGWPLLSRIPVLNWIFSTHSKSTTKVVSVVFIKPTIIYQ